MASARRLSSSRLRLRSFSSFTAFGGVIDCVAAFPLSSAVSKPYLRARSCLPGCSTTWNGNTEALVLGRSRGRRPWTIVTRRRCSRYHDAQSCEAPCTAEEVRRSCHGTHESHPSMRSNAQLKNHCNEMPITIRCVALRFQRTYTKYKISIHSSGFGFALGSRLPVPDMRKHHALHPLSVTPACQRSHLG